MLYRFFRRLPMSAKIRRNCHTSGNSSKCQPDQAPTPIEAKGRHHAKQDAHIRNSRIGGSPHGLFSVVPWSRCRRFDSTGLVRKLVHPIPAAIACFAVSGSTNVTVVILGVLRVKPSANLLSYSAQGCARQCRQMGESGGEKLTHGWWHVPEGHGRVSGYSKMHTHPGNILAQMDRKPNARARAHEHHNKQGA